jgi:cell division protein FtsQ
MNKFRQKISDFFYTNPLFRRVNIVLHHVLIPWLFKIFLAVISLIILIAIALKLFWPAQLNFLQNKIEKKINYSLKINYQNFDEIRIAGNKQVSKAQIIAIINSVQRKYLNDDDVDFRKLTQNLIDEILSNLSWVQDVTISRSLPNILNVKIVEYEPFAIWQDGSAKYLIDKSGNKIDFQEVEGVEKMLILSGVDANLNVKSLFNILAIDEILSTRVYSATWVGRRRWDIRLDSGVLIKLPENNISSAWQKLIKIYNLPGSFENIKIIDLRVDEKVYLQYLENKKVKL